MIVRVGYSLNGKPNQSKTIEVKESNVYSIFDKFKELNIYKKGDRLMIYGWVPLDEEGNLEG